MKNIKKIVKKIIKKESSKPVKMKKDVLYVAGMITKGKNKGKYVAVQVRNSMLLNPVEPIFAKNKGMEYVVVGKDEATLKKIFGRIVAMASQDGLIKVKD